MRALLIFALPALSACAALPLYQPDAASPGGECLARYQHWDEKVQRAGVSDAGNHRITGFPWLRSNRFLTSFADDLTGPQQQAAWLEHLRRVDLAARRTELTNLGLQDVEQELQRLEACSDQLISGITPDVLALIRARARVPDDYSLPARVAGLYPLAVPFLKLGIADYQQSVREAYAASLADRSVPLALWKPKPDIVTAQVSRDRDALGIPQFSDADWAALAKQHAPGWWVETQGESDRPGVPALTDGKPTVDTDQLAVFYKPAFTRFGASVLPQIAYVLWFPRRPATWALDSYAGEFDGLIWRVTLDEQGKPLVYDTIHPCGCYHYFYAAQPLQRQPEGGFWHDFWQEPKLVPQADIPEEPIALRIASGTHYLTRVVPLPQAVAKESGTYELRPYSELLTLPDGQGGSRSLFNEQGMLPASARLERFWLWPSGVRSPGEMRQWGRHATAFVGKAHFDDARLLERVFQPPTPSSGRIN